MRALVLTSTLLFILTIPTIWADEIIKVTWNSTTCSQVGIKEFFQPGACNDYNNTGDYPSSGKYFYVSNVVFYLLFLGLGCESNVDYSNYTTLTCVQGTLGTSFMFFVDNSTTTTTSMTSTTSFPASTSTTSPTTTSYPFTTSSSLSTTSGGYRTIVDTFFSSPNCSGTPTATSSYQLNVCSTSGGSSVQYFLNGTLWQCEYSNQYCYGQPSCTNLGAVDTCLLIGALSYIHTLTSQSTTAPPYSTTSSVFVPTSTTSITPTTTSPTPTTTSPPPTSTSAISTTSGWGQQLIIQTYNQSSCSGTPESSISVTLGDCLYLDGMSMRYFVFGNVVDACSFPDDQCSEYQRCTYVGYVDSCTSVGTIYYKYTVYTPPTSTAVTTGLSTNTYTGTSSSATMTTSGASPRSAFGIGATMLLFLACTFI